MTRKVAWEKWWDSSEEESNNTEEPEKELLSGEMEIDNSGFSSEMFFMPKKVNTPFGQYEIADPMSPANMFDCWICHTNFPICQTEYKILNEEVEGIGAFKVISKYRFFIGVEKLFNFSDIRREIENKICNKDENTLDFGVY